MEELPRIRTPWKQQWRRIRYQLMPVIVVTVCAIAASWLWARRGGSANGLGEVTPRHVAVVAPRDGILTNNAQEEMQVFGAHVKKEQAVAWLKNPTGTPVAIPAPMAGQVVAIHHQAGELVHEGEEIMTIARERGGHIISYIRQEQRIRPAVGMAVEIRVRMPGGGHARSQIDRVGPEFEHVPPRQQRDPKITEWGIPVYIAIPDGLNLRPGELVDLKFATAGTAVTTTE